MSLETFFRDVEARIDALDDEQRGDMLKRVESALSLLTTTNALELFRAWRAPEDYRSR